MRTLKVLPASLMARAPVAPMVLLVAVATVWGAEVGAAQGLSATQIARIDSSVTAVIERHHTEFRVLPQRPVERRIEGLAERELLT